MTSLICILEATSNESDSGGQYPGGEQSPPGFFKSRYQISDIGHLISGLILLFGSISFAAGIGNPAQARRAKETLHQLAIEKQEQADEARMAFRYVSREPYVPQLYDYGIEFGSAHGEMNYYSIGLGVGFHVGKCVFADSQTCQQYVDINTDVNGRDGYTHYLGFGSLRWQFIHFPSSWSPLVRIFAGMSNEIIPGAVDQYFIYGAALGLTTYLHPKADMRIEYRLFQAERPYSQIMFSIQFKMEKWVEYFAEKLKDIGVGTANVTGSVLKGSAEMVGGVVESTAEVTGIKSKKDEQKADQKDQPSSEVKPKY